MLIDAHAHLDRYSDDVLKSALQEIVEARIFTISTAMDLPSYERTLEIAEKCDLVLPTFGIHPWNALAYSDRLNDIRQAIGRSPLLGEIGLDRRSRDAGSDPGGRGQARGVEKHDQ